MYFVLCDRDYEHNSWKEVVQSLVFDVDIIMILHLDDNYKLLSIVQSIRKTCPCIKYRYNYNDHIDTMCLQIGKIYNTSYLYKIKYHLNCQGVILPDVMFDQLSTWDFDYDTYCISHKLETTNYKFSAILHKLQFMNNLKKYVTHDADIKYYKSILQYDLLYYKLIMLL